MSRPPHDSEVPKRTEAVTEPEPPVRQLSPTGIVKMHEDDNNTKVEIKTIDADVEKARLEVEKARLATQRQIVLGLAALVVLGLAVYLGRELNILGVGSTGAPLGTPEVPSQPQTIGGQ